MDTEATLLARWESPRGKHWVELRRSSDGYWYQANGSGGYLGGREIATDLAIQTFERTRVAAGYFLPYAAVLPMKRVS
jgi:hypothetical protein